MIARRQQKVRSSETRALLIEAAVALLQTVGFAGTTTALIANRAGVTTGALHHHYGSKDDLMIDVLDDATARIGSLLDQEGVALTGGFDARRFVDHLWRVYGDPAYWAVWEIVIGGRASEAFHRRVVAHRRDTIETVVHPWIVRFVGDSAHHPDALRLFEFMLIAIRGLSLERFLHRDPAYFESHLDLLAALVGPRLAPFKEGVTVTDDSTRPMRTGS